MLVPGSNFRQMTEQQAELRWAGCSNASGLAGGNNRAVLNWVAWREVRWVQLLRVAWQEQGPEWEQLARQKAAGRLNSLRSSLNLWGR